MTIATFELPSAKNLSTVKAVQSFIPTDLYWEVLESDSNDVIFGTRGSGKTMLLRMMSAQHLAAFAEHDERARVAFHEKKRFGIFIPLGVDWCVAYQNDSERGFQLFLDGVNIVAADCLVEVLDFIVSRKVPTLSLPKNFEPDLCEALGNQWFRSTAQKAYSFAAVRRLLLQQQAVLRDMWRSNPDGPTADDQCRYNYVFRGASLFAPLSDALRLTNELMKLDRGHRWLLCLDELEDLKPNQMAAVATLLRGAPAALTMKITTQPYTLDGRETAYAQDASAVDFRDFEIKRLQHDPAEASYRKLVEGILRKRIAICPETSADELGPKVFGKSTFTERASKLADSRPVAENNVLDSERKKSPVFAIRALRRASEGHRRSAAYSGWETIVRISDGNPGMFVRILNALNVGPTTASVEADTQHDVVVQLASIWHDWSRALYADGAQLHKLIDALGSTLSERLHNRSVEDDSVQEEVNRFVVSFDELEEPLVQAFQVGARHSLLVAESMDGSVRYPTGKGVWRLSYALAPRFWLLPRRGRIARLTRRQLEFAFVSSVGKIELSTSADDAGVNEPVSSVEGLVV